MSRLLILGATGSLGRHVLRQAVGAGHDVTVFVRTPSKLSPEVRERVSVHTGDLSELVPPDMIRGMDALINCAGHVSDQPGVRPNDLPFSWRNASLSGRMSAQTVP